MERLVPKVVELPTRGQMLLKLRLPKYKIYLSDVINLLCHGLITMCLKKKVHQKFEFVLAPRAGTCHNLPDPFQVLTAPARRVSLVQIVVDP